jgi:hypothetical protein
VKYGQYAPYTLHPENVGSVYLGTIYLSTKSFDTKNLGIICYVRRSNFPGVR